MSNEANFYRYCQQYRVQLNQLRNPGELQRAVLYINSACGFAKSFRISDFPISPISVTDPLSIIEADVLPILFQLENYISTIYSENLFDIEPHLKQMTVRIDEDWRVKSTSYLGNIREIIRSAKLKTPMNDAIMARIDDLQRQIDQNQVPLEKIADVIFVLTEAVGKGAKNLDPAVKMFEKIMGAFYGLRRSQTEEVPKQLPAPETLGLPDFSDQV